MNHLLRKTFFIAFLALFIWAMPPAYADSPQLQKQVPISAGLVQETYLWPTSYGNIKVQVLVCDLTHPGFHIEVLPGAGEYTRRATVSQMASGSGAVAVTNGDFFNTALQGSPIGPSVVDGRLQSSPAWITGLYSLGIDASGTAHIEPMIYAGQVTAQDGATFPIDGLNKTYYWHDPSLAESHTDKIQAYNDFWGSPSRGHKTHTEVLVNQEGLVERISWGATLPYEVPDTKTILQVHGQAEDFVRDHVPEGSRIRIQSGVLPDRGWTFLIGGHGLLVDQGAKVPYTKDLSALAGVRARTFAGISQDGKTLWLATAQGRTWDSAGMTLDSMGYFMQFLGAWKAVNLDGGGSTTMVAKDLGSFQYDVMTHPEGYGYQRAVVNGIGIFNVAPEGPPMGMRISGPDTALLGETVTFGVDRAWDANYHPKDPSGFALTWSDDGHGIWSGGYYLALGPGTAQISAQEASGFQGTKPLLIQGPEAIASLQVSLDSPVVFDQAQTYPQLKATLHDGRQVTISPKVATWTLEGFAGSLDGETDLATIQALEAYPKGALLAQVGPHTGSCPLYNGDYQVIELTLGQAAYRTNGTLRNMDVTPLVQNSRTLVPLRFIAEALGAQVEWDGEARQAHVFYEGRHMVFTIDELYVEVDGQRLTTDVPARLAQSRTLVPLRLIGETLGLQVDYEDTTRAVTLIKG